MTRVVVFKGVSGINCDVDVKPSPVRAAEAPALFPAPKVVRFEPDGLGVLFHGLLILAKVALRPAEQVLGPPAAGLALG
jgi:hypothetical protein